MAKRKKKKREYLLLLEKAIDVAHLAIDSFNRVYGKYKIENTLILLTNAWELLSKAILLKAREPIHRDKEKNFSISAEEAVNCLYRKTLINKNQTDVLQQVISLRNQAVHYILPAIPKEIQHHLFFFSCKFFKDVICAHFKNYRQDVSKNYLSISFDELQTYTDTIRKLISGLKRSSTGNKELIWLLERGVSFKDLGKYIPQNEFEEKYIKKRKILSHLDIKEYLDEADMVRIVPIQAPGNFTADINLRKGSKKMKEALPVTIKKTNIENDYPYLTSDIAKKLNKDTNFIAKTASSLKLKGNPEYNQAIRTSNSSKVNRYSEAALFFISTFLNENTQYNPYKK